MPEREREIRLVALILQVILSLRDHIQVLHEPGELRWHPSGFGHIGNISIHLMKGKAQMSTVACAVKLDWRCTSIQAALFIWNIWVQERVVLGSQDIGRHSYSVQIIVT
jgi:hypothetical protein